jgi:hypothetical protein
LSAAPPPAATVFSAAAILRLSHRLVDLSYRVHRGRCHDARVVHSGELIDEAWAAIEPLLSKAGARNGWISGLHGHAGAPVCRWCPQEGGSAGWESIYV